MYVNQINFYSILFNFKLNQYYIFTDGELSRFEKNISRFM